MWGELVAGCLAWGSQVGNLRLHGLLVGFFARASGYGFLVVEDALLGIRNPLGELVEILRLGEHTLDTLRSCITRASLLPESITDILSADQPTMPAAISMYVRLTAILPTLAADRSDIPMCVLANMMANAPVTGALRDLCQLLQTSFEAISCTSICTIFSPSPVTSDIVTLP